MKQIVFAILVVCLLSGCTKTVTDEQEGGLENPLLPYFTDIYPDKELVVLSQGDCNDDGVEDLVVVYREDKSKNHQVTIYSEGGDYLLSEPIPAPYEDCKLEWKDVDERPPCELAVSGRRGVKFGYAILRFENGVWIDIYGGGMEECC